MRTALGGRAGRRRSARQHSLRAAARADGAGLAVVDAGHGVVQVRQMARACVKDGEASSYVQSVCAMETVQSFTLQAS